MQIHSDDLKEAAKNGLITDQQAENLWLFWNKNQENIPHFGLTHVMYYLGGLLAISAVTIFVSSAWEALRGMPLLMICILLFIGGLFLTRKFLDKNLPIPAGIFSTFSLALVPLAIYNLQVKLGFLPNAGMHYADYNQWIDWYWVPMELSTLVVGAIMLYFYRFSFLVLPIAVTLWYMSMDLFALLYPQQDFLWRAWFSLDFGLIVILVAIFVDFRNDDARQDYAFWLYIFGVLTFWGGLSCQDSHNELGKFLYCMINLAMVLVGVFLNRRVFAVFGAFGIIGYLGYLSFTLFANSNWFLVIMVALGLFIIYAATLWAKVESRLITYFMPYMPQKIVKRMRY